jgi:mannitol/fructose-specific phosphotransferase system IIA component (Ntr-type)
MVCRVGAKAKKIGVSACDNGAAHDEWMQIFPAGALSTRQQLQSFQVLVTSLMCKKFAKQVQLR